MTTPATVNGKVEPYRDDAEYLTDEIAYVAVKSARIGLMREIRHSRDSVARPMGIIDEGDDHCGTSEQRRKLATMSAGEEALRARIDARLDRNRASGPDLGILRLQREHDLDSVEVTTLILASLPCISVEANEPLSACTGFSWSIVTPNAELIGVWCGLDVRGLLELRAKFGPNSKLVKAGLVEVEFDEGNLPHRWPIAGIMLTDKTFNAITGLDTGTGEQNCPACGRSVEEIG